MFSRNKTFTWIGIAVLSCMFLMGQESWGPTGNCPTLFSLPTSPEKAVLGDSLFAINKMLGCHGIGQELSLVLGENITDMSLNGARLTEGLGSGDIATIPVQYEQAKAVLGPALKTLVLDGGANDVMLDELACEQTPQSWITMNAAFDVLLELLNTARTDGVENLVYMGVWVPVERTTPGCDFRVFTDVLNHGMDRVRDEIAAVYDDVTFVDTREFMSPSNPAWQRTWLAEDGAHPTPEGAAAVAQFISDSVDFD